MNPAFRYYCKQPSVEMEKQALIVQSKHGLNDMQMAGILQIHDFFIRLASFEAHISELQLETKDDNGNKSRKYIPEKTRDFFYKYDKCSDVRKYFNPHSRHEYFARFADSVLSNIRRQSDYVEPGAIKYRATDPDYVGEVEVSYSY